MSDFNLKKYVRDFILTEGLHEGKSKDEDLFNEWRHYETQGGNSDIEEFYSANELPKDLKSRFNDWKNLVNKFKFTGKMEREDLNTIVYWVHHGDRVYPDDLIALDANTAYEAEMAVGDSPLNESLEDDLFDEWKSFEVEAGNMEADVENYQHLGGKSKDLFKGFLYTVSQFPNFDRSDVSVAVSSIMFDVGDYQDILYNELTETEYNEIKDLLDEKFDM